MATPLTDRRSYVQREGEPLFLPIDAIDVMTRYAMFVSDSGVPANNVIVTPYVATPLFASGTTIRTSGINLDFLYHPLAWLPERLHITENETLDHWALRVALEMTMTGAYDEATGTWFDVLSHLNIAIDDANDRERLARWLDGAPDEALDTFNMDDIMGVEDPTWTGGMVDDMWDDLQVAMIARMSESLLELITDAIDGHDILAGDDDARLHVARSAAVGASAMLADIGTQYDIDFASIRARLENADDISVLHHDGSPAAELRDALERLRDDTLPLADEIVEDYEKAMEAYANRERDTSNA